MWFMLAVLYLAFRLMSDAGKRAIAKEEAEKLINAQRIADERKLREEEERRAENLRLYQDRIRRMIHEKTSSAEKAAAQSAGPHQS